MKKLKSDFTLKEIGTFRLYSGLIIWLGFSIVLNSLFRGALKLSNLGMYVDNWSLDYEINSFYKILIGFNAIAFAFCYATYIWMSHPYASIRKKTSRLRMAQINPLWIFYGALLFLSRMFLFFLSTEITIEKDFPLLGFLFPIFIYLYCWNMISAVYKSKKPFLISIVIFGIGGLLLSIC